jgi:hypothetical protein
MTDPATTNHAVNSPVRRLLSKTDHGFSLDGASPCFHISHRFCDRQRGLKLPFTVPRLYSFLCFLTKIAFRNTSPRKAF